MVVGQSMLCQVVKSSGSIGCDRNAELQQENEVLKQEIKEYKQYIKPSPWLSSFSAPAEQLNSAAGGQTTTEDMRVMDSSTMVGEGAKRKTKAPTGSSVRFGSTTFSSDTPPFLPEVTPVPDAMPRFGPYPVGSLGASPHTATTKDNMLGLSAALLLHGQTPEEERVRLLPKDIRDTSFHANHARFPADTGHRGVGNLLANARKVILTKITTSDSVVDYLDRLTMLEEEVEDAYSEESERTKIMIALCNMDDSVCTDGQTVLRNLKAQGVYDFWAIYHKSF